MNVLVVGGGGREHALVEALARSSGIGRLYAAPGNAGIAELAECHPVPVTESGALVELAQRKKVGLVVVGPEAPLVGGLVDACRAAGIPALGPDKAAAQLEGSKVFTKDLCRRARIPTGGYKSFNEASEALAYCENITSYPVVVKADGLASGKGVVIVHDVRQAVGAIRRMMLDEAFGAAGRRVIIEDFLEGQELSVMALVDGETVAVLEPSRDHKAAFDGDEGPNTGGMGAFSPTRLLTPRLYEQIEERILIPTVHAMARSGRPFTGILYAGLMITENGPFVLEYNVRGGDPEMQVLLPRLKSDPLALFLAAATGGLSEHGEIEWTDEHACGVVLADGGYPETTTPGLPITGVERAKAIAGVHVYHAGTRRDDGRLVTAGGRVLCVTGLGSDLAAAREKAYQGVRCIAFPGMRYRTDIGWRELDGAERPVAGAT